MVAGLDGPVTLLDVKEVGKTLDLEDRSTARGPLAFSPDGSRLATGGSEGEVVVWDTATGKEVARGERHEHPVFCIAFSPDGRTIASGSSDSVVRLREAQNGVDRTPHTGHTDTVCGVVYASDGKRIVSCDYGTSVRVWDALDGSEVQTLSGSGAVAVSHDGMRIACGGPEGSLQVFEASSGRLESRLDAASYGVNIGPLRFSPNGRGVLVNDGGGNLDLWDIGRGSCREWAPTFHEAVTGVALTHDGTRCLLSTKDGPLACFSWHTEKCEWTAGSATGAEAVTVSPDGRIVATLSSKGVVRWFSVADGTPLGVIDPRLPRPRMETSGDRCRLEFAPNGRVLVAMDARGVLRLYELATGGVMCSFARKTTQAFGFAVAPRGARAATGEQDGTVLVWNLLALHDDSLGLDECMRELGSADAATGYRAMSGLYALGPHAVERIAKDVRPAEPREEGLDQLVHDLDSDDPARRGRATDRLREAGEEARASLQGCLDGKPSPEARERAQEILDDLDARRVPDSEGLRAIRAVWVLEGLGSPEARAVLERLAAGAPGARLTSESAAARSRMK